MQPVQENSKIIVTLGKDRYRHPKIGEEFQNVKIDGKIYDQARRIFLLNHNGIGSIEIKKQLNVTYEESIAIMDLLKQEFVDKRCV